MTPPRRELHAMKTRAKRTEKTARTGNQIKRKTERQKKKGV